MLATKCYDTIVLPCITYIYSLLLLRIIKKSVSFYYTTSLVWLVEQIYNRPKSGPRLNAVGKPKQ